MKRSMINNNWVFRAGMLLASVLCFCPIPGQGQCPRKTGDLYFLEQDYESGNFGKIIALKNCRSSLVQSIGTPRSLKNPAKVKHDSLVEPYIVKDFMKVFLRTAIMVDSLDMARETLEQLLRIDPKYGPDPTEDPAKLTAMADSFVPYSANHFGLTFGLSRSIVQKMDKSSLYYNYDSMGVEQMVPRYSGDYTLFTGLEWNHFFGYRNGFITGLSFSSSSMKIQQESPGFNDSIVGSWKSVQDESLNYIHVPMAYQHRIPLKMGNEGKKIFLVLHGGGFTRFLFSSATNVLSHVYYQKGREVDQKQISTAFCTTDRRTRFSTGLEAGVSLGFRSYGLEWFLRSSFQLGITNLRKRNTEYDLDFRPKIWDLRVVDNNFRLNSINMAIGFMIPRGNRVKSLIQK